MDSWLVFRRQIGKAFHGMCTPFFIQTWLQQHSRRTFFHSAHCSLSNPICFRSVRCWRTMIPGKIFTSLAKFHGIVSVNDFRIPCRLQELLKALFCFLRSCGLHGYDWMHWVAKSCTTTAYRWLFEIHNLHWELCNLLLSNHQNFLHEVRLCLDVFCTEPLWFLSSGRSRNFGLSGSEYKHCIYPNPHFS